MNHRPMDVSPGTIVGAQGAAPDVLIREFIAIALLGNGCFYYYFAALTEMGEEVHQRLLPASRLEWGVRVVNQSLLFSLWFALQINWTWFGIILWLIYATYLLWDLVTWQRFEGHLLTSLDAAGLIVSLLSVLLGREIAEKGASNVSHTVFFFWGVLSLAHLGIAGWEITSVRFNPFSRTYMFRPGLRYVADMESNCVTDVLKPKDSRFPRDLLLMTIEGLQDPS